MRPLPSPALLLLLLAPAIACNDQHLVPLHDPAWTESPPVDAADDDDAAEQADDDDSWDETPDPSDGPEVPPDDGLPPDEPGDPTGDASCDEGTLAAWAPGEVAQLSWDPAPAEAVLDSPLTGWFHVYDLAIAESGPSQRNESAFLRIPNDLRPDGEPALANCGLDWLTADLDNDGPLPADTTQYLGTFLLVEGPNRVEIHHFCGLYRQGYCEAFHDMVDAGSLCDTSNPNSVHVTGLAVCLEPA
jgi:hypothetical protein